MPKEKKTFTPETLRAFASSLLAATGVRPEEAAIIAESMVYADLRGVGSHGLLRLEQYIDRIEAGLINLKAEMPLIQDSPACALVDAQNGFGQVAGVRAVDMGIAKAANLGVSAVSVKNSNHYGTSAFFAVRAAAKNMAAIVFTNAGPAMPPFNGTRALLGTNPFAAAVPMADGDPMVLDMATSEVAKGKLRRALANGESIPLGWAVDKDGRPTTDPKAGMEGFVCPMSGPKGSGLALMIDLFSGVLSGSSLTGEVKGLHDHSGLSRAAHLFIVLNPAFFSGTEQFMQDVALVGDCIHGQKAVDGGKVYLPGEMENANETKNRLNGISLNADMVDKLNSRAVRHGVEPLR